MMHAASVSGVSSEPTRSFFQDIWAVADTREVGTGKPALAEDAMSSLITTVGFVNL